jgi:hypothetical protein
MEFRLFYRGLLKSNGGPAEKQTIRRWFHPQLKKLWTQEPLAGSEAYLDKILIVLILFIYFPILSLRAW